MQPVLPERPCAQMRSRYFVKRGLLNSPTSPASCCAASACSSSAISSALGAAGPPDGTWRTLPPPERISYLSFIDPLDQQLTVVDQLQPATTMWKCPLDSDAGWARAVLPAGPVLGINRTFDFRYDPVGHRLLATGYLYDYAIAMILGLVVLLTFFVNY